MSQHPTQPPGTFLPNTKVTVGSQKVYIEKYLSEGGFAHVYVVRVPRDNNKHELAVLKRVAVPDKVHLASMRTEVETMKKLKGHRHIVTYYDSHASQLAGGGYEVFLLMEYCSGGGLIDFMNTRLQHRLTEPEILKIFGDVAEGVACMHYLKPPLLHRDLKVENVLISKPSPSKPPIYKLCDFGSTAPPRPAARTAEEGRLIEDDVQKHTTMQYRSPEMIDVWRKQPIDEKADIWALGVLLYKLCYYTTPFEDVGQMAILNASYKYPSYPAFSDRAKQLIAWMLKEDPRQRPNIYQVIQEVSKMRGIEVPIHDIYANRSQSEARRNEALPSPEPTPPATIGLQKVAVQVKEQALPDITPGRRGRPTTAANSSVNEDPFKRLDSRNYDVRVGAVDELSKRFPSLDDFSIAHETGKVAFPSSSPATTASNANSASLSERVTNALADEVFSQSQARRTVSEQQERPRVQPEAPPTTTNKAPKITRAAETNAAPQPTQTAATRSAYTSTATGTSPPRTAAAAPPKVTNKPIWRVPDHHRSVSQPRASEAAQQAASLLQPSLPPSQRPALFELHRSKSQTATVTLTGTSSARPSLETQRPSVKELEEADITRSRSMNSHSRPTSLYVSSNIDYLRDQEQSRKWPLAEAKRHSRQPSRTRESAAEDMPIEDDMNFLRNSEETESHRKTAFKRPVHQHQKRPSLNAMSGGAKQMFAGRFGDVLKRSLGGDHRGDAPNDEHDLEDEPSQALPPVLISEATPARLPDIDSAIDATEDLPPDVRRELERRRLSQEERRVAEAAAEYRARVAVQGTGGVLFPSKANTIQQRVQSLLDEGRQSPALKKTAEGYGRYTETLPAQQQQQQPPPPQQAQSPSIRQVSDASRQFSSPPTTNTSTSSSYPPVRQQSQTLQINPQQTTPNLSLRAPTSASSNKNSTTITNPTSANAISADKPSQPLQQQQQLPKLPIQSTNPSSSAARPTAPPKPTALKPVSTASWPPQPAQQQTAPPPNSRQQPLASQPTVPANKPSGGAPPRLAALLAKDLEGVPDYSHLTPSSAGTTAKSAPRHSTTPSTVTSGTDKPPGDESYDREEFARRFPSLSGIEMVETEIEK